MEMNRNKYDLVSDVAEMLIDMEDFATCERCIVKDACRRKLERNQRTLCFSKNKLESETIKKYGL